MNAIWQEQAGGQKGFHAFTLELRTTLLYPAKAKRGREEGDGTENVINCLKLSQIAVTFYDEFYHDL